MATWAQVFTAWAGWTIAGITMKDINAIPVLPASADMPMMFPVFVEFIGSGGKPQGFTTGQLEDTWVIDHTCLFKPVGLGKISEVYPSIVALIDLWNSEAAGDPTIAGTLSQKLQIMDTFTPKVVWHDRTYWGFQKRVRLTKRLP